MQQIVNRKVVVLLQYRGDDRASRRGNPVAPGFELQSESF
jgi:hypothetical protein